MKKFNELEIIEQYSVIEISRDILIAVSKCDKTLPEYIGWMDYLDNVSEKLHTYVLDFLLTEDLESLSYIKMMYINVLTPNEIKRLTYEAEELQSFLEEKLNGNT